jgi:hypothetical protein
MKKVINFAIVMLTVGGAFILNSCGDDEPETKSEQQTVVDDNKKTPSSTDDEQEATDALTNTSWSAVDSFDNARYTLRFKANHVVVEEFQSLSDSSNRYTSEGTYSINGNTVATDIDGVLANIYGRKINFRMNGNKLELVDDIWPITFTRI